MLLQANGWLDAILGDLLLEVAVPIEQSERDEIQIEIACRFAMVAGENADAAGIIRDRFVETKLGGEIGDWLFDHAAGAGFSIRVFAREVGPVGIVHFL